MGVTCHETQLEIVHRSLDKLELLDAAGSGDGAPLLGAHVAALRDAATALEANLAHRRLPGAGSGAGSGHASELPDRLEQLHRACAGLEEELARHPGGAPRRDGILAVLGACTELALGVMETPVAVGDSAVA